MPVKKPTTFMTNSNEIANELGRRCDGSHQHQTLLDGRAVGPLGTQKDCRAICRGIVGETRKNIMKVSSVVEGKAARDDRKLLDPEKFHDREESEWSDMGALA